ncbi:MAG TPA: OmpA family protein [Nannocystaceae bacterium]|nr:OmpA family protein [Nannocystaceae bacterium]
MLPIVLSALLSFAMDDPFSFDYPGTTDASGQTQLVITANDDIPEFEIVISGDGQEIKKTVPGLKRGKKHTLKWKQKGAQAKYQLVIDGKELHADFAFEMIKPAAQGKIGKLRVKSSREDIVKRHTAEYETTFALARYEWKIYDSDGDVIGQGSSDKGVPANGTFTVKWDSNAEVFMIWAKGEDEAGRFTEYKLVPWAVEIPHTEINFDSGKWDVKPDESPKLDEAVAVAFHELDALERVNEAVGANITPRLYIVGFTDTVGPGPSNDELSKNRAKAIAKYFFDKGFWAEIYFAGMGERALRVETGDQVDEVRNRRALYVIGVDTPPAGGQMPGKWAKLAGARKRPAGFVLPALPEQWAKYREERRQGVPTEGTPVPADDGGGEGGDEGGSRPTGDGEVGEAQLPESDDGPPPVGEGPGASKKGCSIASDELPASFGLFALLALATRRRRG